jgi:hypothetical protein
LKRIPQPKDTKNQMIRMLKRIFKLACQYFISAGTDSGMGWVMNYRMLKRIENWQAIYCL